MKGTKIGWADDSWNPWQGCTKVSPGCKHCYMFTARAELKQDPSIVTRSKTTFNDPLKWMAHEAIFTCSWSDFFHEAADPWRAEAWEIIRRTPQHTYLILTKRHERMAAHLPWTDRPWPHQLGAAERHVGGGRETPDRGMHRHAQAGCGKSSAWMDGALDGGNLRHG